MSTDESSERFRYAAGSEHEHGYFRARYIVQKGEIHEDSVLAVRDGAVSGIMEPEEVEHDLTEDLGNVALVPGQVDAHSHAFQRAIRGRTEYLDADRLEDDFWSWREKMYRAALELDPDDFETVARYAFLEMVRAGYTCVGEFHYVHHDREGHPYEHPNELGRRVLRAAREVGIDLTLLRAAYHRAGYDKPPNAHQRRFREPDVETYLSRVESLIDAVEGVDGFEVGLAPHSIRAVPGDWFEPIAAFAGERGLPVHIHASEQPGELEESRAEYGETPIRALDELGLLSGHCTVVHATHTTESELDLLAERDGFVCACPTTERNLGDGFLPIQGLARREIPVCLGTDSHADIDPWQEMRLVEYHERLRERQRNVLAGYLREDSPAGRRETARALWPMGSAHGLRALGRERAGLEPGDRANFAALDLEHLSLAGASAESLRSNVVFAATPGAVSDVFVGGEPVVERGCHPDGDAIRREFVEVMEALGAES